MRELDDDPFEPFDVLLEEVVQGEPAQPAMPAQPAPARGRARWAVAALLLLGVGAVIGAMLASRSGLGGQEACPVTEPVVLPEAQDPAGSTTVQPPVDRAGWSAMLARVRSITVGTTTARGARAGAEDLVTIADETDVAQWRAALLIGRDRREGGFYAIGGDAPLIELRLLLDDGGVLLGHAAMLDSKMPFVVWQPIPRGIEPGAELIRLLLQAQRDGQRQGRFQRGEALSVEELHALPASRRAIRCPCLTAAQAGAELPRFRELTRLAFDAAAPELQPHGEVVDVIAALPTLRSLSLPGARLDAGDLQALARSGRLQELEAFVDSPGALAIGLRSLAGSLRTLRVHVHAGLEHLALPHAEREVVQRERVRAMAGLAEAIVGLPHLQCLDLGDSGELGDAAFRWLVLTKLDQLHLAQTEVTPQQVAMLAGLPSLRVLSLRGTPIGDSAGDVLAKLTQLRRLDLANTRVTDIGFDTVRSDLPRCDVLGVPLARVFYDDGKNGEMLRQRGVDRQPLTGW